MPLKPISALIAFACSFGLPLVATAQPSDVPEADAEVSASAPPSSPTPPPPSAPTPSAVLATESKPAPPVPSDRPSTATLPSSKETPSASAAAPTPAANTLAGITFRGYVQAQVESHQDSADQLQQGGALYNQNRFVLQRARIEFSKRWDWASALIELDANTINGPSASVQRAEASFFYDPWKAAVPLAELTLGLFRVPFGAEVQESPGKRWFTERTTGSRALWPSEVDVGGRIHGGVSVFRYAVAVVNGEPKGEKSGYQLQDPNNAKDLVLRLGVEAPIWTNLGVTFGVSYANGTGFSPGSDATKNLVTWRDSNENGTIDQGELVGNPSATLLQSKNFKRWALGADARFILRTPLGETSLMVELIVASNMDRGLYVADPVLTGVDVHELAWTAGITQEITEYGVLGFRFDHYDPNSDLVESRSGKLLPKSQSIDTFAPLIGFQLKGRGRLVFQYSAVKDFLGRTSAGVPTDLKNDTWTLRLQAHL